MPRQGDCIQERENADGSITYRAQIRIRGFEPKQIDGSEDRAIKMPSPGGEVSFRGQDYLFYFALPNLFFHAATAYNILRHDGVEVGKMDFLGRP